MKNSIEKMVTSLLKERLSDYKDQSFYGCDLAYTLFEGENANGSYTFSAWKATQWIKKNFDDLGEIVENMEFNGLSVANPFNEPEKFQVQILLETADGIMGNLPTIEENRDGQFVLNRKMIAKIRKELTDYIKS